MSGGAARKISKYHEHAEQHGCSFVPFIIDSFGCLGKEALQLLKDIEAESLDSSFGPSSTLRLSRSTFLTQLSSLWQHENAKIVVKWLTMCRDNELRKLRVHFRPSATARNTHLTRSHPQGHSVWAD